MKLVSQEHAELQKLRAPLAAKASGLSKLRGGAKKPAPLERDSKSSSAKKVVSKIQASPPSKTQNAKPVLSKMDARVGKKLKSTL